MGRQRQRQRQRRESLRQQSTPATKRTAAKKARPEGGMSWVTIASLVVIAGAAAALVLFGLRGAASSGNPGNPMTPGNVAQLAPSVDGVQCNAGEQLQYHIHQHIMLYSHGKYVALPSSIGMPGGELSASCYYWIHVHLLTPNIIHVESPSKKIYNLGNFFDIWKATESSTTPQRNWYLTQLTAASRRREVTAYYNGKLWRGSFRSIPLTDHAVITVEIGKPVVPPKPFSNWQGLS